MKKNKKITRKKAIELLYNMWENGEIPNNFTEDHSNYEIAINQLITLGYLDFEDLF
jgi:hypothetical protein